MKGLNFVLLAAFFLTAMSCAAQTTTRNGVVIQVRTEKVNLAQFGGQLMKFTEAQVDGKVMLLLLPGDCPVSVGTKFKVVEGHGVPRHIVINDIKHYDYMHKYLNR